MRVKATMKWIIAYLLVTGISLAAVIVVSALGFVPAALAPLQVAITCAANGGLGGCVYCLRAVYLNACVQQRWDDDWQPWYYIRPMVSIACGGVAYLFLTAGLLVLEAGQRPDATDVGYYALAFIAGLNVDKFMVKIEGIAQATWGIEPSRASRGKSGADE